MGYLRKQLQEQAPELHAALLRSWEIAENEWIPAIKTSEGSFNSFPHFRNIERQLDSLMAASEKAVGNTLKLSSLELYLLLAAVLFHDIGRVDGDKGHAGNSAKRILRDHGLLGIPSYAMAMSLARISRYHDPKEAAWEVGGDEKKAPKVIKQSLREIRLEPHGVARELCVASVLALADHMDGSFMRSVPEYVTDIRNVGFKGAFRRMVSGTGYDPDTYTIKTTLSGFEAWTPPKRSADKMASSGEAEQWFQLIIKKKGKAKKKDIFKSVQMPKVKYIDEKCRLYDVMRSAFAGHKSKLPAKLTSYYWVTIKRDKVPQHFINRVDNSCGYADKRLKLKIDDWPHDYLLGVVLNDLRANQGFLDVIEVDLRSFGLQVDGWLLEFDSLVYDCQGKLCHEKPTIDTEFLKEVAKAMWEFRSQVTSPKEATFDQLADFMREESVGRVALVVKRISKLGEIRAKIKSQVLPVSVITSESSWKFKSNRRAIMDYDNSAMMKEWISQLMAKFHKV